MTFATAFAPTPRFGTRDGVRSRSRIRTAVGLVCAAALVAGVSGMTAHVLFAQASTLKYGVTVAGPLLLLCAAAATEPLLWLGGAAIFLTPFSGYAMTVDGIAVQATVPLLVIGGVVAVCSPRSAPRWSATGRASLWFLALLAVPVGIGLAVGHEVSFFLTLVLLAWLVARAASRPGGQLAMATCFVTTGGLQGLIAIWEFKTGHTLSLYTTAVGGGDYSADYFFSYGSTYKRPIGSFSDPISLANILAACLPVGVALTVVLARRARWALAALTAGSTFAASFALVLTFSRLSWIGAAAGTVLLLVMLPRGLRARTVGGVALSVVFAVIAAIGTAGPELLVRFESISNPTGSSVPTANGDRIRQELWAAAIHAGETHPVFGVGSNRLLPYLAESVPGVGPSTHAHSTYLQTFAEAGLVGVAGLIILLSSMVRDLAAHVRRDPLVAGLAGSFVAMLLFWSTDYTIQIPVTAAALAPLFGLVAAARRRRDDLEPAADDLLRVTR